VDSPKVIMTTAETRGVMCTGYHANQASLAPKGYLSGAEWDWSNVYSTYAKWIHEGKSLSNGTIPHLIRGGLKDGFCKVSSYGPAVSDDTKTAADAAKAKFMDGSMVIYKGELKDNAGKVVIPAGSELKQQDIALEKMDWLLEGVIGKTGG
jgi:simple sugar transport system substrate-binding protein